ncbi:uncharacterized protein LOC112885271 [Panicum hallii]|uniref:uncharacterized protein LOC112885271 n=1 Tax=Panicum hallii TaxID=206008 RepID=UPI000DF4EF19|nr:uncharacterized protein LOC112885271 [Panicum hallii]
MATIQTKHPPSSYFQDLQFHLFSDGVAQDHRAVPRFRRGVGGAAALGSGEGPSPARVEAGGREPRGREGGRPSSWRQRADPARPPRRRPAPPGAAARHPGLALPAAGGIIGIIQPLLPPLQGGALGGLLPAGASHAPPPPAECMTSLAAVAPCTDYLTNATAVATPPGECCDGLRAVVRDAPICLCHGTNGGMNRFLPRPVDPLRMAVLPLACGAVLPIQTLFLCNSNQVPPMLPPTPPATPPPVSP